MSSYYVAVISYLLFLHVKMFPYFLYLPVFILSLSLHKPL